MNPLEVIHLASLIARTEGRPEIAIGFIDGPVALNDPDLAHGKILEIPPELKGRCGRTESTACLHGTFGTGILSARRRSAALLWSLFPNAPAEEIRRAVARSSSLRRGSIVPPLLDAEGAYQTMSRKDIQRAS